MNSLYSSRICTLKRTLLRDGFFIACNTFGLCFGTRLKNLRVYFVKGVVVVAVGFFSLSVLRVLVQKESQQKISAVI